MCICPPCAPAIQEVLLQLQGLRRKESTPAKAPSIPEQLQQATGYREKTPQCQPQALEDPAVCLKQLKPASSVDQETHFRSMHILYPCINILYIYNTIYNNRMTACMYTCRQKKKCAQVQYIQFLTDHSSVYRCACLGWMRIPGPLTTFWCPTIGRNPLQRICKASFHGPPTAPRITKGHQGSPRCKGKNFEKDVPRMIVN